MTKSISRSQVRLIVSTNAIFGADEACAMLRISRDAMYRLAKDPDDPFPIRYIGGKTRDGIVLHDELVAWVERNSVVGFGTEPVQVDGALYCFVSRDCEKAKILRFDVNGWCLYCVRLTEGGFK